METQSLFHQVEVLRQEMTSILMRLMRIPAIAPENGGEGEFEKAELLMQILSEVGFDMIERFDANDSRVSSGKRPNIVATLKGELESKIWVVSHLDVVPSGEESLWKISKPFEPLVRNGCVFGRGSEDNGQSIVSSIFAIKALKKLGVRPRRTFALALVADEEQGSHFGIRHLIEKGLFNKNDLVVVPDSGEPTGSFIEIVEKSILWFKIITMGKQTHGSMPNKGLNAHRAGMQLALELDASLHRKYSAKNDYFTVPYSTFEPTKKDKNVDAVNIVPGEDTVYFDCRILPQYNLDKVLADIISIKTDFENKTGAKIEIEIIQNQPAPTATEEKSEIVNLLKNALSVARGLKASVGGIGGGTCAAFFRKQGIPAVVWSTIDEVAHQPDEYAKIDNMVEDAKVFALLASM